MNRIRIVASVLDQARKYRDLTRLVGDPETEQRILELVHEMKRRALVLAKPDEEQIRLRAREMWEENGWPSGRDEEFWYRAEREFREAEDLARQANENA